MRFFKELQFKEKENNNNNTPTSSVTTINELPEKFSWNLTGKNMEQSRKETIMQKVGGLAVEGMKRS